MKIDFSKIKNIIFDLGGVILNIDYALSPKAFKELGIPDFQAQYSQLQQSNIFDLFETGEISSKEFISKIKSFSDDSLTDEQIIKAWNAMILDLPLERIRILKNLKSKYKTFLLSNTNEIHEEAFNLILEKSTGKTSFDYFFDKVYLSHKIRLRKPNKEAFEIILNENNLLAEETLFIDDSPQHIEAAQKLGLKILWLKSPMAIEKDVFNNYL